MYSKAFLAVPLFLSTALGLAANAGTTYASTEALCLTVQGSKSIKKVPTTRSTSTIHLRPYTITKTTHSTVKITPAPKTIIVTYYAIVKSTTTLKTITKPFTTTLTETDTSTSKQRLNTLLMPSGC